MYHYVLTLFFIFTLVSTSLSATSIVNLDGNTESYTSFFVDYFEDTSDIPLSIDQVRDEKFQSISNAFTFGYKDKPLWLKFELYNNTSENKNMILELTEMFHKTVDMYLVSPFDIVVKNGLNVPIQQRTIEEINPSFKIHIKAKETLQMYIKLESDYPLLGAIIIKTPQEYYNDARIRNGIYLFYFGAISILAFYNLFIFIYLRDKIYFYYVSYVLLFTVWFTLYKGFIFYFINVDMFNIIQSSLPSFIIMLILFSQSLLETKKYIPRIHTLLNVFIVMLLFSIIWMLASFQNGFHYMNIIVTPIVVVLLVAAVLVSRKGSLVAKLYLFALFIHFVGISLVSMLALTFIPYSAFVINMPLVGSFIEIILFSLLLAYRINILREEKLDYQNKLLIQESTESIRLNAMVNTKTSELKLLNEKLENELDEKVELEKILKHQASTDSLTGISNRRNFFNLCDDEVKYAKRYVHPLSFIIIDIDYFKEVNDSYGHLNGDIVLIDLVRIIQNTIRDNDIFGRIGGEEFAVLMPEADLKASMNLAERIRTNIAKHKTQLEEEVIGITVSIGLSTLLTEDTVIQTVLRRADLALFKAKQNGRNQLCCSDDY